MIFLFAALIVSSLLQMWAVAVLIGKLSRQQMREREVLVNQILHLSGRTWSPPPRPEAPTGEYVTVPMVDELVPDPENYPDY